MPEFAAAVANAAEKREVARPPQALTPGGIGAAAIILKGVTIGENSVIGAGSVVVRDVPPNCVAAGNPVRVVKRLVPDTSERDGRGA